MLKSAQALKSRSSDHDRSNAQALKSRMISPKAASELLNIPTSTIRRYAKTFKKYLSPEAQKRRRVYTDQDLAILSQIRDLSNKGFSLADIPEYLDNTIDIGDTPQPRRALTLPGVTEAIDEIRSQFEQYQDSQDNRFDEIQKSIDALEAERLEREERDRRPWWKKITGR